VQSLQYLLALLAGRAISAVPPCIAGRPCNLCSTSLHCWQAVQSLQYLLALLAGRAISAVPPCIAGRSCNLCSTSLHCWQVVQSLQYLLALLAGRAISSILPLLPCDACLLYCLFWDVESQRQSIVLSSACLVVLPILGRTVHNLCASSPLYLAVLAWLHCFCLIGLPQHHVLWCLPVLGRVYRFSPCTISKEAA
jgi:hypothetical protein